jgi:hypothetical protein
MRKRKRGVPLQMSLMFWMRRKKQTHRRFSARHRQLCVDEWTQYRTLLVHERHCDPPTLIEGGALRCARVQVAEPDFVPVGGVGGEIRVPGKLGVGDRETPLNREKTPNVSLFSLLSPLSSINTVEYHHGIPSGVAEEDQARHIRSSD